MFTIQKLEALPPKTRRRKIERLIAAAEAELDRGRPADAVYLARVLGLLASDHGITASSRDRFGGLAADLPGCDTARVRRHLETARLRLLGEMGAEPSEWDHLERESPTLNPNNRVVLPIRVYLEDVRSPYNVGSIFRTAECLGAREVVLSPDTPLPTHPRATRTARGTAEVLPWRVGCLAEVAGDPGVFALETGGTPLDEFVFPKEGTVIVGSEELGVSPEALEVARSGSGRVSIPLRGAKRSLNVSVAFGILMQAWAESIVG